MMQGLLSIMTLWSAAGGYGRMKCWKDKVVLRVEWELQ